MLNHWSLSIDENPLRRVFLLPWIMQGEVLYMSIILHASIPQIQSAIKFGGDGSARVQFDVPSSELPELLKLMAYAPGKLLKLEIEVVNDA